MTEVQSGDGPQKDRAFTLPQPEQLGFRQIIGIDVHPQVSLGQEDPMAGIARLGIDKTEDRRSRWTRALTVIGKVAEDAEKRKSVVNQLNESALSERHIEDPNAELIDILDFTRSVLANFKESAALKHVLERGAKDPMQQSIATAGGLATSRFSGDLAHVVEYSMELARELYIQKHDGKAYQSAERADEVAEALKRAKKIRIK